MGLGTKARRVSPFVPSSNADCVAPCVRAWTSYTAKPPPDSAERMRNCSSAVKESCEILTARGTFAWGVNDRASLSPTFGDSKALLADSVVAMWTASGPAAATSPLRDAMLIRDAVGAGGGDHREVSWTLASPTMERNPRPYSSASVWGSYGMGCIRNQREDQRTSVWITSRSFPMESPPAPPAAFAPMAFALLNPKAMTVAM